MSKYVLFAFQGEVMCFQHVLLNALDLYEKGHKVKVVMEGQAVKLVKELVESDNKLFAKARDLGLIDSVCKACSNALGVLEYNEKSGIPLGADMNGHPSMEAYLDKGYQVITL